MTHAPLYFDQRIDGKTIAACDCEWETDPQDTRAEAIASLNLHVTTAGDDE